MVFERGKVWRFSKLGVNSDMFWFLVDYEVIWGIGKEKVRFLDEGIFLFLVGFEYVYLFRNLKK